MSVACPNCASPNDDGAGACRACGAALPRVCASCAAVNGPTARFCSACGTPLAGRTAARTPVAVARGYLPKDRAEMCDDEYQQIDFAYRTLIAPHQDGGP